MGLGTTRSFRSARLGMAECGAPITQPSTVPKCRPPEAPRGSTKRDPTFCLASRLRLGGPAAQHRRPGALQLNCSSGTVVGRHAAGRRGVITQLVGRAKGVRHAGLGVHARVVGWRTNSAGAAAQLLWPAPELCAGGKSVSVLGAATRVAAFRPCLSFAVDEAALT